jgi:hypothetical protein
MHPWQTAAGVYFLYIGLVAAILPRLASRRRRLAFAGAAVGLLAAASAMVVSHEILNDWVIPPVVLLIAYWTSGLLFVAPMPEVERRLLAFDRRLAVSRLAAGAPRVVAEFLELAYAAVYPAIPIALAIRVIAIEADASRFWTVILITDFLCFGMLPWVQTRPPRSVEQSPPWHARLRALNVGLLGRTSIHANTFPSGHAAEALAAALLVLGAPAPLVVGMFFGAVSISAGAVLGRYHYAADAIAGWGVAFVVWWLVMEGLR